MLAGSLQEEEEGVELQRGRASHTSFSKAVDPPGNARQDCGIICDLARRLGKGKFFPFKTHRRDLRRTAGGLARRASPTTTASPTRKIDQQMGVFWPCPIAGSPGHSAFDGGGVFFIPMVSAVSCVTEWRESGDPVDADFPIYLTTGRVVSQYLSGTQTRRIGALVDQYPEPERRDSSAAGGAAHGIKTKATG